MISTRILLSAPRSLLLVCHAGLFAGGLLRIAGAFWPQTAAPSTLATLYGATDLCLLLGVVGLVFLQMAAGPRIHAGLSVFGFILALIAAAMLLGPDISQDGIDFYPGSAAGLMFGLVIVGFAGWRTRTPPRWTAILWTLALAAGGCSLLATDPVLNQRLVVVAGAAFGLAAAGAGYDAFRTTGKVDAP